MSNISRQHSTTQSRLSGFDLALSGTRLATLAQILVLFLIIAGAIALRWFRIDGQSLWYDEGTSALMATRAFDDITRRAAADIHPPLYYYLLHIWSGIWGMSESALRSLSAVFGVLLIPVVFGIGRRLFGSLAGICAAALTAIAPFQVYYSQEARMYEQVTFFGALSIYLLLRWRGTGDNGQPSRFKLRSNDWLILYTLVTLAFIYSHYFSITLIVAQNLFIGIAALYGLVRSGWRSIRWVIGWIVAQVALVLAFLPWVFLSYAQLVSWPSISEPFTLPELFVRVFRVFTWGLSWDAVATTNRNLLPLAALGLGLLWLPVSLLTQRTTINGTSQPDREDQTPAFLCYLLAVCYALVPVLLMFLLSINRPAWNPKFLLLASPGYYLLLGLAPATLMKLARLLPLGKRLEGTGKVFLAAVGIVALLLPTGYYMWLSLQAYYFDPKYQRDDYRGAVQYIENLAQDGDVIILNAPGQQEIFGYYYRKTIQVVPLPSERPIDESATGAELQKLAETHKRIWVVFWATKESDPHDYIENWLNLHTYQTNNLWFGTIRVGLFTVPQQKNGSGPDFTLNAHFGDQITLVGYSLNHAQAKPGQVLELTLYWQASAPVKERYTVFAHILDAQDNIWGQRDTEPGNGALRTDTWQPGTLIEDKYGIPVLYGTPPGEYTIEVGLYLPQNGQRLPVRTAQGAPAGDNVRFGPVGIFKPDMPPSLETVRPQHRVDITFAANGTPQLKLVGYDLNRLGYDLNDRDFHTGDVVHLSLLWQAQRVPQGNYTTLVRIVDASGKAVAENRIEGEKSAYPMQRWTKDELVRDMRNIRLSNVPPGTYRIQVALDANNKPLSASGSQDGLITLDTITVK